MVLDSAELRNDASQNAFVQLRTEGEAIKWIYFIKKNEEYRECKHNTQINKKKRKVQIDACGRNNKYMVQGNEKKAKTSECSVQV